MAIFICSFHFFLSLFDCFFFFSGRPLTNQLNKWRRSIYHCSADEGSREDVLQLNVRGRHQKKRKYKPISDSPLIFLCSETAKGLDNLFMAVILLFCRVKFAKTSLCLVITLPVSKPYGLSLRATYCKYAKHAEARWLSSISLIGLPNVSDFTQSDFSFYILMYKMRCN